MPSSAEDCGTEPEVTLNMPADTLRFANREVFFQKAITSPDIGTKSILARDAFQFVDLWLKRNKQTEALFYWTQSRSFYLASRTLPTTSSPLTIYYCMLNAVKSLLVVKGINYSSYHGVSGEAVSSRRSLENEIVELHNAGILAELSRLLGENEPRKRHSLKDILANLPFIHRTYCLVMGLKSELVTALYDVAYVRHPSQNKVWLAAEVRGLDEDRRVLRYIPAGFEIDEGIEDRWVIRRKTRVSWFPKQGATKEVKAKALQRLREYHRNFRIDVVSISGPTGLWYLKKAG